MRQRVLAAVLLSAAATAALAGPEAGPPVARVEIVGTLPFADSGIDRDLLPYPVQVSDHEALREAGNLTGYMVRNLNGVNANDIAGSPFQTDVTYRGFRASPTLGAAQGLSVYLDGVRVNEPFGDVVNWDMLPEAAIGKLLLVPGSNPLYGLNTLGGALALRTRSGRDAPGVEGAVSAGMAGRRRADLSYGAQDPDGWNSFVAATVFGEQGWRAHSAGRLGNLFVKLGRASAGDEWWVSLLGARSNLLGNGLLPSYRIDGGTLRPGLYESDPAAAYTFPDRTRNRLSQAAVNMTRRVGRGLTLTTAAYARSSRRDAEGGDVSDDYADYVRDCAAAPVCTSPDSGEAALHPARLNTSRTWQQGAGGSVNLHGARASVVFDAGATYDGSRVDYAQMEQAAWFAHDRQVVGDDNSEPMAASSVLGNSHAFGAYAAGSFAAGPSTTVTASGRWNRARVGGTLTTGDQAQPAEAYTYTKLNPSVGINHSIGPLTWRASAGQGNRAPTVIELGCADPLAPCRLPVGLQSDPYLRQVVARTIEAGARGQWGALEADLSLYRTVNRDDILFVGAGATSRAGYFVNVDRTLHLGAALSLAARLGAAQWRFDYSYLRATYGADASLFTGLRTVQVRDGTPLAGLPRHTLKLGVDWDAQPGLVLGADLQAQSGAVAQGNEDGLLPDADGGIGTQASDWSARGFALLNVRVSWKVDRDWEVFCHVSNVLDRRYETYAAVAADMFPNGELLRPQAGRAGAPVARFVAPGAPRLAVAGLRYRF